MEFNRRELMLGAMAAVATTAVAGLGVVPAEAAAPAKGSWFAGTAVDNGVTFKLTNFAVIDPRLKKQMVKYKSSEPAGTIVVDTRHHFLYLIMENGTAIRYGVGVGRDGFQWFGRAAVDRKALWPKWTPPKEMIARQPELAQYGEENGGMPPGLDNPLGARALYIFQNGEDTLYRLHGSPEWNSIGRSVSSGCVRLMNQDIIDLYDRVPGRAPILVTSGIGLS